MAADIAASNGVIHAIDKVLLPPNKNIVETAIASTLEFSILVEAVTAPFTVFAPTNAAFAAQLSVLNVSAIRSAG